jgi:AcrR family transcriptional regulator
MNGNGRAAGGRAVAGAHRAGAVGARDRREPRVRMLAAMIDLVGEQGYASTTVADVIARAGASRRTFYEHFANNEACFLTAGDEIAERWLRRTAAAVDGALEQGGDAIGAFVGEIFDAALASPGEMRLLASDLPAAEQSGIERRELIFATLSQTLSGALPAGSDNGGGGGLDTQAGPLLTRALVGAIVRIPFARVLRDGRVRRPSRRQLLALAPEVAGWAATCFPAAASAIAATGGPPPVGGRAPGTLALSTRAERGRGAARGEGAVSHSFVVHSQRERLLDAVANLSAVKGYGAVTIPAIVHEAGVSVEAFYEHFDGRDDALLVAYELGRRKMLAVVERAYQAQERWPAAVRAGVEALLAFLASEPSFAHLALIDVPAAGGRIAAAAREGPLPTLLKMGLRLSPRGRRPPEIAVEASASAVRELCYTYAATARTHELRSLGELATRLALAPFTAAGVAGC